MPTASNILGGVVTIYRAPVGEALPALNDLAPPTVTVTPSGNWVAIGYAEEEDYELEYTVDTETKRVQQETVDVDEYLVGEHGMLRFSIAEDALSEWAKGIAAATSATVSAGADQTAQTTLAIGGGTFTKYAYLLVGNNPTQTAQGTRFVHIYKAVMTGPWKKAWSKAHKGIAVEAKLLGDTTVSSGSKLLKIYDITAAASS